MLRFVHLSDIHFSGQIPGIGFDPDRDIRNELKIDLKAQTQKLGKSDAILVTGDVAYAGKKAEYDDAALWLIGDEK